MCCVIIYLLWGDYMALLVTLLSGLSFYIGYLITNIFKDEKKLKTFSIGFAFTIMLGLCFFDILGECLEMENKLLMVLFMVLGVVILKILDLFIPDHEHHKRDEHHTEHIGIISTLALFLHNMLEGTAIYSASLSDLKVGLFMAIGVSLHNIPLGIQISSLVHKRIERIELLTILALSSIVGVLIINVFNINLDGLLSGILMSLAFGMLIYIAFFELMCEVKENIKKRELIYGLITGIVFIIIGHFIH